MPARVAAARGDLREPDRLEDALNVRQRIGARGQRLHRPRQHFLRSAAGGNQADARLRPGRCRSPPPPARARRAGRSRSRRPATSPAGATTTGTSACCSAMVAPWNAADHQVHFVPVALLRLEQQQHQVGAGGEVRRVVADDQRREVLRGFLHAGVQHLDRVAADRVHLRVELDLQHAVAHVDQARAGVLPYDAELEAGGWGSGPSGFAASAARVSNGPSSQPNPHRIALSMSPRE